MFFIQELFRQFYLKILSQVPEFIRLDKLDPTRPTTMANVFMLEIESPILEIPDVNSYNLYFGWYLGELEQNDEFFDEYHEKYPDRAIGFSEYGADANPQYQSAMPEKGDYTESYITLKDIICSVWPMTLKKRALKSTA